MTSNTEPPAAERPAYQPPAIERIGTLHELTQGGTQPQSDGHGGAGSSGTL